MLQGFRGVAPRAQRRSGEGSGGGLCGEVSDGVLVGRGLLQGEVRDVHDVVAHHEPQVVALADVRVHDHAEVCLLVGDERRVGAERARHDRVAAHDDGAAAGPHLADRAVDGVEGAVAPCVERGGHARLVYELLERGVAELLERRVEYVGLRDKFGDAGRDVELAHPDGGGPADVRHRLERPRDVRGHHEGDVVLGRDVVARAGRLQATLHGELPLRVGVRLAGVAVADEEDGVLGVGEEGDERGVLLGVHDVRAS